MIKNRLVSLVLCFTLVVACLPIFSLSASADNEGFCQIRIFYKTKDSLGNWSAEKSAIITDDSFLQIFTYNMAIPVQITRFLVRNDSDATCYFQFDINFGGQIPPTGTAPTATYSSLAFTVNGGVTAYSFDTTDKSNLTFVQQNSTNGTAVEYVINSATSRTFFGRVDASGYITFNSPVNVTFRKNDSPAEFITIFFRHLIIGTDNSSYLSNIEHYLADISEYSNNINDILQHHEDTSQNFLDAGGAGAVSDALSYAIPSFSLLRSLFTLGGLFNFPVPAFSYINQFWTSSAHDMMQGTSTKGVEDDDDYIDFYQINHDKIWGIK